MFQLKVNKKSLVITVCLHFLIYTAYLTTKFIIGHNLFSILDKEWLHIPAEKWLISVIPSLILIKVFKKELYMGLKEMFTHKVKLKTFLWFFIPVFLYFTIGFIGKKYFGVNLIGHQIREFEGVQDFLCTFSKLSWWVLVTAAIPEETLSRAWILNAFLGKVPDKNQKMTAIVMSSVLFAASHLPSYIFFFKYSIIQIISNIIPILIIGLVFGSMFLKSKNIILPIFIHWFWDTFMFTFFV